MQYQLSSVTKTIVLVFTGFMAVKAGAFQYVSYEDQTMVQQWIESERFTLHSADHHTVQQDDRWLQTRLTLQALHSSRPEEFYRYLAKQVISGAHTHDEELSQLLQPVLNVNRTQEKVMETFILEQNDMDLAYWLRDYMGLAEHLTEAEDFYLSLFDLLTQKLMTDTQPCTEMLMLERIKSLKEQRHATLQCIAQRINLTIIDIDISYNRITTSKMMGPEPLSTDLSLPSPTDLEDSEEHIATILGFYHTPELKPVILFTSPLKQGFLQANDKTKRPPVAPLTESEIEGIRQKKRDYPDRRRLKRERHLSSWKPGSPHVLEAWFTSPGYSIALFLGISVAVTLFTAYFPYPGNPWRG